MERATLTVDVIGSRADLDKMVREASSMIGCVEGGVRILAVVLEDAAPTAMKLDGTIGGAS